ncbi:MAG: hypothetical protein GC151_11895 [Betaproteobacteria bacterium]|nr:hypothetical protein [Betaproteobacteria bacterium]
MQHARGPRPDALCRSCRPLLPRGPEGLAPREPEAGFGRDSFPQFLDVDPLRAGSRRGRSPRRRTGGRPEELDPSVEGRRRARHVRQRGRQGRRVLRHGQSGNRVSRACRRGEIR